MRKLLFPAFAAVALAGCSSDQQPPAETLTLKVALNDIYCKDTACACVHHIAARTYAETQRLLLEEYNIDLQIDYYIEPYQLEEEILSGKYDGVICKPWIALMLEKKAGADFERIADIVDPAGNRWFVGEKIAPDVEDNIEIQILSRDRTEWRRVTRARSQGLSPRGGRVGGGFWLRG